MVSLFAAEEGAREVVTSGPLLDWAWVLIVAPLVAAVLIVFFGKRMPYKGGELAVGAMAIVFGYALVLFLTNVGSGVVYEKSFEVATIGPWSVEWGWYVDGLSSMMYTVVGTVGLLVFIYALGYMHGEERFTWFFAAFSLFAGAMLVLVSATNFIQLIVGWEGVGVASYLLIGFYWEDHANVNAGNKAFLVNKVADVGLIVGAITVALAAGSFRISDVLDAVEADSASLGSLAVIGAILLFIGAVGKSAQFPLHVWLPDAMAGPTPVSALMHAATMVTAGVYLLARLFPLYESMAPDARVVVLVVGTITLVIAGLLAIVQDDIKRVLAYSTVSQLGYMVAAIGAGGYVAGLFHLWTHAFFKALLFLGAGSVIHAVHSNNMSDMGGLRKYMPTTYSTFVVGSLALAGIIPLSGFFSKDEILATFSHEGYTAVFVIGLIGAFITAFYMAKTVFLTFHGTYKGHGEPHESPRSMTVPLQLLAVLAVVAGWVNIPGLYTGFTEWVETRAHTIVNYHPESLELSILLAGLVAAGLGIAAGYVLYYRDAPTQAARDRFRLPVLWPLLENKYYLDDLYIYGIVNPIKGPIARFIDWTNSYIFDGIVNAVGFATAGIGRFVYSVLDQRFIDLTINGLAEGTFGAGGVFRRLQTGKVQQYAAGVVAASVVLTVTFLILS